MRASVTGRLTSSTRLGLEVGMSGNAIVQLLLRGGGSAIPGGSRNHEEVFYQGALVERRPVAAMPVEITGGVGLYQLSRHVGTAQTCNTEAAFGCVGPDPLVLSWSRGRGVSVGAQYRFTAGPVGLKVAMRHHWVSTSPARRFILFDLGVTTR